MTNKSDSTLGLDTKMTRRDYLNATLIGASGILLNGCMANSPSHALSGLAVPKDWYGYGGVGDYEPSHGNTPNVVTTAHRLRDGGYSALPANGPVDEEYDFVIIGGGISGLSAAWHFMKHRDLGQTCLLLDNHPIFGGEAKENEFNIDGKTLFGPQGANGFFLPKKVVNPYSEKSDTRYYNELGLPFELPYVEWKGNPAIKFGKDNYGHLHWMLEDRTSLGYFFRNENGAGSWSQGIWRNDLANTPLPDSVKALRSKWHRSRGPIQYASASEKLWLDSMTYHQYLEKVHGLPPEASSHEDPFIAAAFGLGGDVISAYGAHMMDLPGIVSTERAQHVYGDRNSFPGGNSGFARHFLKAIIPSAIEGSKAFDDIITGRINFHELDKANQPVRIRLNSMAISVAHDGPADSADSVVIIYADTRTNEVRRIRAKHVVMASGGWVNRHVVKDMPASFHEAYAQFFHAPFLVVNVALRNWKFMEKLGITAARWENGVFGFTCNIRLPMAIGRQQPTLDPNEPAILTFYVPFTRKGFGVQEQCMIGRQELYSTSYVEYERQIREQLTILFGGAGFDAKRDIAGIILNRWGHAYIVPPPGFFLDRPDAKAPRNIIREGYGRIAFGHSELMGLQHWGDAADEGRRAISSQMAFA